MLRIRRTLFLCEPCSAGRGKPLPCGGTGRQRRARRRVPPSSFFSLPSLLAETAPLRHFVTPLPDSGRGKRADAHHAEILRTIEKEQKMRKGPLGSPRAIAWGELARQRLRGGMKIQAGDNPSVSRLAGDHRLPPPLSGEANGARGRLCRSFALDKFLPGFIIMDV